MLTFGYLYAPGNPSNSLPYHSPQRDTASEIQHTEAVNLSLQGFGNSVLSWLCGEGHTNKTEASADNTG